MFAYCMRAMRRPDAEPAGLSPPPAAPRKTARDLAGLIGQVLLTLVGVHMSLAVGFTLSWGGQPVVSYRHPVYGLGLVLLGAGWRWVLSPAFRWRCGRDAVVDAARVRAYAAGGRRIPWRAALLWVFVPALVVYQSNDRTVGSGDTVPMVQTALSVLVDGDLTLDEFVDPARPPYYVCRLGEHCYSRFSLGPAVLAVPFVQLARWGGSDLDDAVMRQRLEKVIASLVAAAAAMLVFVVLLRVADLGAAIALTVFFTLGSSNWSIASQALWQHGPVALCVAGVLLVELHAFGRVRWWARGWQGMLLGFAVGCRPTVLLLVGAIGLLAAVRRPRQLPALLGGVLLAYAPFALVHVAVYHSLLGPYAHAASAGKWAADVWTALAGNLISPGRGLLVYQPLVVLAVLAFVPRFGRRLGCGLVAALGSWLGLHLLVVSCYTHWWGGHAWGPRFLTELMPALVVLMVPATGWLWHRRVGRAVFLALVGWSVGLQALGVYSRGAQRWMNEPVDIDQDAGRLWDWSDPPFAYPWRSVDGLD